MCGRAVYSPAVAGRRFVEGTSTGIGVALSAGSSLLLLLLSGPDVPPAETQAMSQVRSGRRPRRQLRRDRGWAATGLQVGAEAGLSGLPREPALVVPRPPPPPPWEGSPEGVTFGVDTARPTRRTDPPDRRLAAAEETLAQLPPADVVAFTDGSATEGVENGGAGAVIFEGDAEPRRIRTPAGRWTSSFRAEMTALDSALRALQERAMGPPPVIRVCTDSRSALVRLRAGPAAQTDSLAGSVWGRLRELADRGSRVHLRWVPGHAGLPGNEVADEVAREAADLEQGQVPVAFQSARARLRRHAREKWEEQLRPTRHHREVGPERVVPGERLGLSRRESVEAARLRTGHSTLLAAYRHRIGQQADPTCPECREEEETLAHLMTECPARAGLRRDIFGRDDPLMREVLSDPTGLVALLRRLGRL